MDLNEIIINTRNWVYSTQDRNFWRALVKPTGNKPLGRPSRRWEDNIRMDLNEIGINTRN